MRVEVVMDTNVAVVANGNTPHACRDCVLTCIDALARIRERYCLLLDDGSLVLDEYRRHLSPSGQPGPGDAFFKWLWNNQGHLELCRRITLTPSHERGFVEFPDDPDLARFDRDDRKFVAIALKSDQSPPVLNASDPDWWEHRAALHRHGVQIEFLCPELMTDG